MQAKQQERGPRPDIFLNPDSLIGISYNYFESTPKNKKASVSVTLNTHTW